MTLVSLVLTLIVIGVLLYVVNTYVPMDGTIKQIINVVVILVVIIWLCGVFGLLNFDMPVPRVRT